MELFEPYRITILVCGFTGLMIFIQILVADISAIKAKHTPGFPISADHESFLFRAARTHANTNESIGIFVLFVLFGLFSGANPQYLNVFSVIYLVGRIAHMVFYYLNFKLARSISFPVCLLGLTGMFVTAMSTQL